MVDQDKRALNIVFLCKRRPQQRDLVSSPYGRFFNIPDYLAREGHRVSLVLANYKTETEAVTSIGNVKVHSVNVLPHPLRYVRYATRLAKKSNADWVVGLSDTYFGILATRIARTTGCRALIDAYDNYEAYIPWAKPLHWLWHKALSDADAITAAGPGLLDLMRKFASQSSVDAVMPMAADDKFRPAPTLECRRRLNLSEKRKLIGYCGSAVASRGFAALIPVLKMLTVSDPDIQFVVTGRKDDHFKLPTNTVHLGVLPDDQVPLFVNSLNLAIAVNRRGAFGDHSYPVKIYEALACERPVIASRTLATEWIFKNDADYLFDIENHEETINKIIRFTSTHQPPNVESLTWSEVGIRFERLLERTV